MNYHFHLLPIILTAHFSKIGSAEQIKINHKDHHHHDQRPSSPPTTTTTPEKIIKVSVPEAESKRRLRAFARNLEQEIGNGNEVLEREELEQILEEKFRDRLNQEVRDFFTLADLDKDELLSFEEFSEQKAKHEQKEDEFQNTGILGEINAMNPVFAGTVKRALRRVVEKSRNKYKTVEDRKLLQDRHWLLKAFEKDYTYFDAADVDQDAQLSRVEFAAFQLPETSAELTETVVDFALRDLDKDENGRLSFEEYAHGLQRLVDNEDPGQFYREKRNFDIDHDANKDGELDRNELEQCLIAPRFADRAQFEANRLIEELDENNDKGVSLTEIVGKPSVWTKSPITEYGKALENIPNSSSAGNVDEVTHDEL